MRVAQLIKYDKNNPLIQINDIPTAPLGKNDVLVQTSVAGVNPLDNLIAHGELKLVVPYDLPQTLGNEFVGIVKAIGPNVKQFKVGERVFARNPINNIGAFASSIVVNQSALAKVPAYLSDEEAAAVPLTALTVMQALDILHAKSGQTLFISGGTGSFGEMAIPIAVAKGLKVFTTGNIKNKNRVLELGATRFFDYKKDDYTKDLHDIDLVIDTVGEKELSKEFEILKEGGSLVSLRGMPTKKFAKSMKMGIMKQLLFSIASHKFTKKAKQKNQTYNFIFVHANGKQLSEAANILAKKQIRPLVGTHYPLTEVKQALSAVKKHSNNGKVIIKF